MQSMILRIFIYLFMNYDFSSLVTVYYVRSEKISIIFTEIFTFIKKTSNKTKLYI